MGIYKEEFLDGATGANNPVEVMWNQAMDTFETKSLEEELQCLVSIGNGEFA
jgi:hypothetical protein